MNAQNAKDYLPLVQAMAEGKTIQESSERSHYWSDGEDLVFDLPANRYRIKPEPRRHLLVVDSATRIAKDIYSPSLWDSKLLCEGGWELVEVVELVK